MDWPTVEDLELFGACLHISACLVMVWMAVDLVVWIAKWLDGDNR